MRDPTGPWFAIRRVRLWPSVRLGCVLGSLAGMPVAAAGAAVLVLALRAIDGVFDRVEPIVLNLAGHEVLRVDLLDRLGLSGAAESVGVITDVSAVVVAVLFLGFVLLSGAATGFAVVLGAAGYNLLAAAGLALEFEVGRDDGPSPTAQTPWNDQISSRPELPG